jgi:hypothetical protein
MGSGGGIVRRDVAFIFAEVLVRRRGTVSVLMRRPAVFGPALLCPAERFDASIFGTACFT